MPAKIRIQSSDGEIFKVEMDVVKKSKTIRTMLEDLGIEANDEEEVMEILPLPNVNAMILKKVIDWCTYHKEDPEPAEEEPERRNGERIQRKMYDLPEWDAEFVKVDKGILFEIIIAANYLHIQGLIDMTCMTVAKMLQNKTPEQIRKEFNIVNDFTPNPGFEDDPFFDDSEWKKKNRPQKA
jgi:S-phase kinase-associated protein 1